MSKLVVSSVLALCLLSACAAGTKLIEADRTASSGTPARLDFAVTAAEEASGFPRVRDPRLPSVDRIGSRVRAELGDTATAAVELCVAPSGQVTKVELVESSTLAAFDAALLRDATSWRFASLPGPATLQTCSRATVTYHPHY